MSAAEVGLNVVNAIESGKYTFVLVNFANPDMTGHTGIIDAAIKGVQAADAALAKIMVAAEKMGFSVLVTADHCNREEVAHSPKQPTIPGTRSRARVMPHPSLASAPMAWCRAQTTAITWCRLFWPASTDPPNC